MYHLLERTAAPNATRELGSEPPRSGHILEIAVDPPDTASIRPLWRAVLGCTDEADGIGVLGADGRRNERSLRDDLAGSRRLTATGAGSSRSTGA